MFGWTRSSEETPLQIGFAWPVIESDIFQPPKEIITLSDLFKKKQEDIKPPKKVFGIFFVKLLPIRLAEYFYIDY